jgi:hypothetical protein
VVEYYCVLPNLDSHCNGIGNQGKLNNPLSFPYLEGHRLVGGLRASLYNAMAEEGVDALAAFMHEFEQKQG